MSSIKRCTDGFPVQVAPSGGSIAIDVIACGVVVVIVIGASVPNLKHVHATIGKAITDDRLDALIFAAHGDKLLSNNGHAGGNVDFRVPHDVGGDDLRGPCGRKGAGTVAAVLARRDLSACYYPPLAYNTAA